MRHGAVTIGSWISKKAASPQGVALVTGSTIAIGLPAWWTPNQLLASLVLAGMGFIVNRLHSQDKRYDAAMRAIETMAGNMLQPQGIQRPDSLW
jgi:hypothetical protein